MSKISPQVQKFINDLQPEMRQLVQGIEKGPQTTQNNYGGYMTTLSTLGGSDRNVLAVLAMAMLQAGGNAEGIKSALRIIGC